MGKPGALRNLGGCARQYYDACVGGRGTDLDISGGFLRPCYGLGPSACDVVTGGCRCAHDADPTTCVPHFIELAPPTGVSVNPISHRRRYSTDTTEKSRRGAGSQCTCPTVAEQEAAWFVERAKRPLPTSLPGAGQLTPGAAAAAPAVLEWWAVLGVMGGWLLYVLVTAKIGWHYCARKKATVGTMDAFNPSG